MNKHMNRRRFSASLALTAVATAALLTGCGKVPDTIKIGVAQPLSGPLGALGQDLLNGVKLRWRSSTSPATPWTASA